jgi:hypothetical protein
VSAFSDWLAQKLPGPSRFIEGSVMPALGRVIESPLGVPLVVADKVVNEIFRRPVATAFTVAQGLQSGDPISPREAYNLTDREALPGIQITPGQAATTFLGQNLLNNPLARIPLEITNTDEKIQKMIPFLNPEFNIKDTDERRAAYKDAFWGSFVTGLADISVELLGAKGAGSAIKAGKLATGVTRSPLSSKFLDQTRANVISGRDVYLAQNSPTSLKAFRAPNGDSVRVFEILNSKNGSELLSNPFFRERPDLADLAAATKTWDEAAAFYLASQGDSLAARALQETAPSVADSLKEITKIQRVRPLTPEERATYQVVPTKQKQLEMEAVFNDLVKRNPNDKAIVKEFTKEFSEPTKPAAGFAPSQYAYIEKHRLKKEQFKNIRYTGQSIDEISENIIGGGIFRPFVFFAVRGTDQKPFNVLRLTGPYAMEPIDEMNSWVISSSITRKMRDSKDPITRREFQEYQESMMRDIRTNMGDETLLKRTVREYEYKGLALVVKEIARRDGIVVDNIDETIEKLLTKRDTVKNAAIRETMLFDESRNTYIKLNTGLKTLLADSVVLIDLDKFARTATKELKDQSTYLKTDLSRNVNLNFELFNSVFSTSVLVKPGYVPKNSILEPQFRYISETGNIMETQFLLPATSNWLRNVGSTLNAKVIAPYSKVAIQKRKEIKQLNDQKIKLLESDLPVVKKQLKEAQAAAASIGSKKTKSDVDKIEKLVKSVEDEINNLKEKSSQLSGDLESYYAGKKGAKRSIIEKDVEIDAAGQQLKLESAWKAPGGKAAISEIDPLQTLVASVSPITSFRIATGTQTRQIATPGTKDYWNGWAEIVEKLRLNDSSFKMALEGKTQPQIAKALMDDYNVRGKRSDLMRLSVSKRIDDIDNAGIQNTEKVVPTMDDARYFASEAMEMSRKLLPDDGLKEAALTRPITAKELRARYKDSAEPLEITAMIPLDDVSGATKWLAGYQKASSAVFKTFVAPESKLYKIPFVKRESDYALNVLVKNSAAQGVELTAPLYEKYKALARNYAIKRAEETFYQIRRYNNFQYYSRYMIGFSAAMFNSLRYWTKSGMNNPYQFALLEQIRTVPWDMGMVVGENGELVNKDGWLINEKGQYINESGTAVGFSGKVKYDGETYLALPYYNDIWAKVQGKPGYEGLQPYNKKINTRMFSFLVNGPNPAWLGQIVLGGALTTNPMLEPKLKNILDWDGLGSRRFGDLVFSGRPAVSFRPTAAETAQEGFLFFVPRWIREGWDLAGVTKDKFYGEGGPGEDLEPGDGFTMRFKSNRMAETMWLVHNARRYNGEGENPNFIPDQKTTEEMAYGILVTRFLERVFSPFGVTYQPSSQMFQDEKLKLIEYYSKNPEQKKGRTAEDAAWGDLIARHGEEKLSSLFGFTTGSKERPFNVDPTIEGYKILRENIPLVEKFLEPNPQERKKSLGILSYDPIPGEFSDVAYAAYDSLKIGGIDLAGRKRTFAERQAEASIRQGWFQYNKMVAERDAELSGRVSKSISYRGNQDIVRRFSDKLAKLKQEIPAWGDVFGDSKKDFDQNIKFIDDILGSGLVEKMEGPKKQMWEQIGIWHAEYMEVAEDYKATPTTDLRMRSAIRAYWEERTSDLRLDNTYFADFHTRWLSGDEVIDVNELLKSELPQPLPNPRTTAGRPTMSDMFRDLGKVG